MGGVWRVMVLGTRWLAEACREVNAKLFVVSRDWVFGQGGQLPYAEDSPPWPVNYFGFLKVIGETVVSGKCDDSAIVRIAGVYGSNRSDLTYEPTESGVGFSWLASYFVHRQSQEKSVAAWSDHVNVWAHPSLVSDVAEAMLTIVQQGQVGRFHC